MTGTHRHTYNTHTVSADLIFSDLFRDFRSDIHSQTRLLCGMVPCIGINETVDTDGIIGATEQQQESQPRVPVPDIFLNWESLAR